LNRNDRPHHHRSDAPDERDVLEPCLPHPPADPTRYAPEPPEDHREYQVQHHALEGVRCALDPELYRWYLAHGRAVPYRERSVQGRTEPQYARYRVCDLTVSEHLRERSRHRTVRVGHGQTRVVHVRSQGRPRYHHAEYQYGPRRYREVRPREGDG